VRGPLAASAVIAPAAGWLGPGAAAHCPPLARLLGVPLRLDGLDGVALTFDDGPHPVGTRLLLDELAAHRARATFFLVGEQVRRWPSLVAELVAAGHEPAVHGDRHRNQMRLGPRRFAADLRRAVAIIAEASGRAPVYYRPPYGVFTLAGLREVRRAGLTPLLWSRWGRDWRRDTDGNEVARLVTCPGLRRGDVVLLHDADHYGGVRSYRHTAAALPAILAALRALSLPAVALPADVSRPPADGGRRSSRRPPGPARSALRRSSRP
jgi:peptidoglycan/xylan/chitin deacetylase (PgdA/CDA1 family)